MNKKTIEIKERNLALEAVRVTEAACELFAMVSVPEGLSVASFQVYASSTITTTIDEVNYTTGATQGIAMTKPNKVVVRANDMLPAIDS